MQTQPTIHHRDSLAAHASPWRERPWSGVYPATLCPFHEDESIDEAGLVAAVEDVASVPGIQGIVCNGHTGEIMSLSPDERARVTRLTAEGVARATARTGRHVRVISGVSAEGSREAIDHATAARDAGADAILLMPPHHWLRFGRSTATAVGFVEDVAANAGVSIIIHQYPAWTKAGYTLAEMQAMVRRPEVVMVKMGTRDMARWRYDYEQLKATAPHVSITTCHDEFLLASLLEGADGALIGFAGFVPELMVELVHAALDGDLARARAAGDLVAPLARIVYAFGEPGCGAHQRMKAAKWLLGRFPSPVFRRPIRPLSFEQLTAIRVGLEALGLSCPVAPTVVSAATRERWQADGTPAGCG
ncbi:MAG: dihydrodipicolinate synthase family protein [Planctomycetes bacterium]|nr:dihydrodipicolinate synthase family protein [Planctomycetota bacterium]